MEYTPGIGNVIGLVEILYGVLKIALEIFKGLGNLVIKNKNYNFTKEMSFGLKLLIRGIRINLPPIIGGFWTYQSDKDCVWRYNFNNAIVLLDAIKKGDFLEGDLEKATEYAYKLPDTKVLYIDGGTDYGDLSYRYSWAERKYNLLKRISSIYVKQGKHAEAQKITNYLNSDKRFNLEKPSQADLDRQKDTDVKALNRFKRKKEEHAKQNAARLAELRQKTI